MHGYHLPKASPFLDGRILVKEPLPFLVLLAYWQLVGLA